VNPIKLAPTAWNKDTNLIVANGVRVLGSITGATNASPIVVTSAGHELRDGERYRSPPSKETQMPTAVISWTSSRPTPLPYTPMTL
jgi:hypothetical protein